MIEFQAMLTLWIVTGFEDIGNKNGAMKNVFCTSLCLLSFDYLSGNIALGSIHLW